MAGQSYNDVAVVSSILGDAERSAKLRCEGFGAWVVREYHTAPEAKWLRGDFCNRLSPLGVVALQRLSYHEKQKGDTPTLGTSLKSNIGGCTPIWG